MVSGKGTPQTATLLCPTAFFNQFPLIFLQRSCYITTGIFMNFEKLTTKFQQVFSNVQSLALGNENQVTEPIADFWFLGDF